MVVGLGLLQRLLPRASRKGAGCAAAMAAAAARQLWGSSAQRGCDWIVRGMLAMYSCKVNSALYAFHEYRLDVYIAEVWNSIFDLLSPPVPVPFRVYVRWTSLRGHCSGQWLCRDDRESWSAMHERFRAGAFPASKLKSIE